MGNSLDYFLDIDKLKQVSKKAGINSLSELCRKANIHKNSITPYVKRKRSPFTQVVLDISRLLNIPVSELISSGTESALEEVRRTTTNIIREGHAVFLFGSRSRGTHKKYSDVDLGITGGKRKIEFEEFSKIKSEFDDRLDNFSLSINLVDLDLAPLDFLTNIEPDLKFFCGDISTANYFLGYLNGRKAS